MIGRADRELHYRLEVWEAEYSRRWTARGPSAI